ncbi:hypothetical protein DPMN_109529 [Dreissena polymorpha]|uniref:Uncharacterized protein n=1 Tax=Dreissena polymorpha TaxID=45954 RepID=A0A9D4QM91_DREPO|nr:hypothetical protein DPMN_109529 [Dreissena polymorpha]
MTQIASFVVSAQEGVQIRNVGQKPSTNIYELNPDHTYFIIADEETQDARLASLRCAIENQFRNKSARRRPTVQRLMSLGLGMCYDAWMQALLYEPSSGKTGLNACV